MIPERCRLLGAAAAALAALLLRGTPAQAQITVLDTVVVGGSSLAIGSDGLGLIAYTDATNKLLKVAHCSNLACTSATLSILDDSGHTGGFDAGYPTRIAIGSDGFGLILYFDNVSSVVRVAHCRDVTCSSADLSPVSPALAIDDIAVGADGLGLITATTYVHVGGAASTVFHCQDVRCSFPSAVGGTVPAHAKIAIGADALALIAGVTSFINTAIVHCTDTACTAPIVQMVLAGGGSDIVVGGDGRGLFPYHDYGSGIQMAHCVDEPCSAITSTPTAEWLSSLTVGRDGRALGTSFSGRGSDASFRVSHCGDAACSVYTLSPVIDSGTGASLRVGSDGLPLMAYGDKVAHCLTTDCLNETTFSASDAAVVEGPAGPGLAFTVSMSAPSGAPISVSYSTGGQLDTATPGVDYTSVSGALTFAPGTTAQSFVVPVLDDGIDEPDETLSVHLDGTTQGVFADGYGLGTITDDDAPPVLSVSDASVTEGDSGTVAAHFTISLSAPSAMQIDLSVATADGTATAPSDYTAINYGLFLPAGHTSISVDVPVLGDTIDEADETFELHILPDPSNSTIGDGVGVATILDDDATPAVSIGSATVVEGDSGTTGVQLPVSLSGPSGFTVSVDWQTGVGPGETATPDVDFITASGTVSFAPGQLAQSVSASVVGDSVIEPDELFHLQLTNPTNAVLGGDLGRVTISDDDAPSLSFDELVHGSVQRGDLQAQPGPVADVDYYRLAQAPFTSWEVVVDGASGDVVPVILERLAADNITVLQTGATATGGSSVALRWSNDTAFPVLNQHLSVRSGGCSATCDSSAVYRIRAYDTGGGFARFNNSATQVTVVILENTSASPAQGTLYFWGPGGTLLWSQPFSLAAQGESVIATATVPALAGASGTITVTSDAPYGSLQGKAVAVEPATGFSFDTPLTHRPR